MTRHAWIDMARAVCILLVVLHHTILFLLAPYSTTVAEDWWFTLDDLLTPLRIPLFFFISGLLAHSSLTRSWQQVRAVRIFRQYGMYLFWLLVTVAAYAVLRNAPDIFGTWRWLPINLVLANSALWYLYALVLYFCVAKLLRRFPRSLVAATALVSAVGTEWITSDVTNPHAISRNAVFFMVGVFYPQLATVLAGVGTRLLPTFLLAAVYLGAAAVRVKLTLDQPIVLFALSILAIAAGVAAFAWVSKSAMISATGAWLGAGRTLPIYVLHLPLTAALVLVVRNVGPLPLDEGIVFPIFATLTLVVVSLGIHQLLDRTVPFIFSPKAPWPGERSAVPAGRHRA